MTARLDWLRIILLMGFPLGFRVAKDDWAANCRGAGDNRRIRGVQLKTGGTGRVNLILGFSSADDPVGLAGSSFTEKMQGIHATYMWNPTKRLRHGIELLFANREAYNGADGDLTRVQWSSLFMI